MKKPTYFVFETPLSMQNLFMHLPEALREYNANSYNPWSDLRYEIPKCSNNRFRIGIERAGHSLGGYWYCATIQETDAGSCITGSIVFNPDENNISQGSEETIWDKLQTVFFFVLLLIPIVLIWIGLGVYYLYRRIRHPPRELNKEEKLVEFMTKHLSCTLTTQR